MADRKGNKKGKMGKNKKSMIAKKNAHARRAGTAHAKKAKITARGNAHSIHAMHGRAKAKVAAKSKIKAAAAPMREKPKPNGKKTGKGEQVATQANVTTPEDARKIISTIMSNQAVIDYLKKNVSKRSTEVISMLSTPKTDEYIAAALGMKVNAVRRILNILQGYGVTNYHVSKNNNGWLSFGWYINANKMPTFLEYIDNITKSKTVVDDNCNDYFICRKCFDSEKFVYTFDAAFEAGFKCKTCNSKLERIDRSKVEAFLGGTAQKAQVNADQQQS
ncbi:MAG: hypothetical protein QXR73_02210 [Candidatus Micrarchaeaceae archaeon]